MPLRSWPLKRVLWLSFGWFALLVGAAICYILRGLFVSMGEGAGSVVIYVDAVPIVLVGVGVIGPLALAIAWRMRRSQP